MQYSDDAKTEFKLNSYHDKGVVLSALQTVRYRGGNTKTGETNTDVEGRDPGWGEGLSILCNRRSLRSPSAGVALKHVYEKVFTSDSGMRRNVPKVLVVVTDGRSQDDVKKSAEKLQHSGIHAAVCTFDVALAGSEFSHLSGCAAAKAGG